MKKMALLFGGFVAVSVMLEAMTRTPDFDALALRCGDPYQIPANDSGCNGHSAGTASDWIQWELELADRS